MNKQLKSFLFVLLLLAVGIAALFLIKFYNQKEETKAAKEEAEETMEVFSVEADDITAFSYVDDAGDTLSFHLEDDSWLYDGDTTIDLDEASVNSLLAKLTSITSTKVIENQNATEYGFDTPGNVITITTEDQTVTLTYGMQNEMTQEYYLILNNDSDLIYVTDGTPLSISSNTVASLTATDE